MTYNRSVVSSRYSGYLDQLKTDRHDIIKKLLKVALKTINPPSFFFAIVY